MVYTTNKIIKKISKNHIYNIETIEYQDSLHRPIQNGMYSKYSIYKDETSGNPLMEYFYDSQGEIFKSEYFEYDEYGNRIARGVAGIDGTLVRCPNWDWDGLTFYKMAILYPFGKPDRSVFVSAKGFNEFGESSPITKNNDDMVKHISIDEVNYHFVYSQENGVKKTGVAIAATNFIKSQYKYPALYLHVLSKNGTFYNVGLQDGDILIKYNDTIFFPINQQKSFTNLLNDIEEEGGKIIIARAEPGENRYKLKTFIIPRGKARAEFHKVELNEAEYHRLKNNIN